MQMETLGIDIGGSGIKGAPVDTETGAFTAPRLRLPTPEVAKPTPVAEVVAEIARHFDWYGRIGCGFPAVIRNGIAFSAANVHRKWIGTNVVSLFSEHTSCPVCVVNDADAAGMAEMAFGAGRGRQGIVLVVTIGTGLGSALFLNGRLVPNTELGHLEIDGVDAEWNASDAARKREKLSWKKWGQRFNVYLNTLEKLFWPDLFILGGGISKQADTFMPFLEVQAEIVIAQLLNDAGIVGAALAAETYLTEE
jgi:polyphosphate glucokinase